MSNFLIACSAFAISFCSPKKAFATFPINVIATIHNPPVRTPKNVAVAAVAVTVGATSAVKATFKDVNPIFAIFNTFIPASDNPKFAIISLFFITNPVIDFKIL